MRAHIFASPVGEIFAAVNEDGALVRLDFLTHKSREASFKAALEGLRASPEVLEICSWIRVEE